MDLLLEKYNDYARLIGCRAVYELENGLIIEYIYRKDNFVHLIGLHKLEDILLISMFNDKSNLKINTRTVIKNIKNGKLTDKMVRNSAFFHKINERYNNFSYDNLTTLNYTDAVVDFNPTIINSQLKSDYLLFEEKTSNEYNHLGIAIDNMNGVRYAETFIHSDSDYYINGQKISKIKKFALYDKKNNVIVQDSF